MSNGGLSKSSPVDFCFDWRVEEYFKTLAKFRSELVALRSREEHSHAIIVISSGFSRLVQLLALLMSLPQSLRTSVTPPELELVASEHLVEIIPLVSMDRTAFISVRQTSTVRT